MPLKRAETWAAAAVLAGLAALLVPLVGAYFEAFPHGWDQTEYCWAIRDGFLPHSPYLFYWGLGRLLALFLPPPVALSLLSAASLVAAAGSLHVVMVRVLGPSCRRDEQRLGAAFASASFLFCFAVFRQGMTQEVYMLQTALILSAAACGWGRTRRALLASSLLYALALSTHNGSVFHGPAIAWLWWWQHGKRGLATAIVVCAAGVLVHATILLALLPSTPGADRAAELLTYLRGISPIPSLAAWGDPSFWRESLAATWEALSARDIPLTRPPTATSPLGLNPLHGLLALGSLLLFWRGDTNQRRSVLFWLLFMLPYLGYRLGVGRDIDYGVNVAYVIPAVVGMATLAFAGSLAWIRRWLRQPVWLVAVTAVVLAATAWPSANLLCSHRHDVRRERAEHARRPSVLAQWLNASSPRDAIVLQHPDEANVNLLPYYVQRRHTIILDGTCHWLFRGRPGDFTPINIAAFSKLTREEIERRLMAGAHLYAFEEHPLKRCPDAGSGAPRFRWERVEAPDDGMAPPVPIYRAMPTGRCRASQAEDG